MKLAEVTYDESSITFCWKESNRYKMYSKVYFNEEIFMNFAWREVNVHAFVQVNVRYGKTKVGGDDILRKIERGKKIRNIRVFLFCWLVQGLVFKRTNFAEYARVAWIRSRLSFYSPEWTISEHWTHIVLICWTNTTICMYAKIFYGNGY